ncbi:hypothetical protein [Microcella sp.]|uniref:hypothetical protein n=1 Tax=Microcella sp. TaxID=1913979 RepID=UPI003F728328
MELEPWAFGEPPAAESTEPTADQDAVDPTTLEAGDTIDEELARELNRDITDGLRGYELPDGTFMVVRPNEPLPPAVRADAEAKAAALPVVTGTSVEEQTASASNGLNLASTLSFLTGKRIVAVVYGTVAFTDFTIRPAWRAAESPLNEQGLYPIGDDRDAVVAEAQALVAQQSNPAEWEIIVQPR